MKTAVDVYDMQNAFVVQCLKAGLTVEQAETAMLVVVDSRDVVLALWDEMGAEG